MNSDSYGKCRRGARALAAGAISTVIMASGNVALATGDGSRVISGNSVFSDCGVDGSDVALLLTGDLEGCLSIFVQGYSCRELNGFAHYKETGREAFTGTWRSRNGRFTTKYTIDAAYAQGFCTSFDFSLELSGSCRHHITGRSGVFADTEGVFTMFDVITNVTGDPVTGAFAAGSGGNNFLYSGRIRPVVTSDLSSAVSEISASAESRAPMAASVAARKSQSRRGC
jgi:hypothetical protein